MGGYFVVCLERTWVPFSVYLRLDLPQHLMDERLDVLAAQAVQEERRHLRQQSQQILFSRK